MDRGVGWEAGDICMQMYAARGELQQTIDLLSLFLSDNKAKDINSHDFIFCLNQLGDTRETVAKLAYLWRE